jgi:putative aldouronate transport system substrate-binding protein
MMSLPRSSAACALVMLLAGAFSAPGADVFNWSRFIPTATLSLTIMGDGPGTLARPPMADAVTPVLREKTGVSATVVPGPANGAAGLAPLAAANALPEIITGPGLTTDNAALAALVEAGALWDFSDIPTLQKLFPNLARRITQWGDLSLWQENEATPGATHVRLTQDIAPAALRKLSLAFRGSSYQRRTVNGTPGMGLPATLYFRDDLLRQVYPKARTQADQESFFQKTFSYEAPTGASDPYRDIPIAGLDDLHAYLAKVKEIIDRTGMKDGSGRDPMLPAQLTVSTTSATAALASTMTMGGTWWTSGPFHLADTSSLAWAAPWMKTLLAWWNRCYSEGLLDPALFTKKGDQLAEEMSRGRFAVIPGTPGVAASARAYAKTNGLPWGWRQLPAWWPASMKTAANDASNQWVSYASPSGGTLVTKTVSPEDLAQVCNWLDYHYSEEFDILKSWGPVGFTAGADVERRFRAAYRDLEAFQVYGITGARDGYYYGILGNAPVAVDPGAWNWEVQLGTLTRYPLAPQYVYPEGKARGMDFDSAMLEAWTAWYHQKQVTFFPLRGWNPADLDALPQYAKIRDAWPVTHAAAAATTITGAATDFETNYAAYQALFNGSGYPAGIAEYQQKWKSIFDRSLKSVWKQ